MSATHGTLSRLFSESLTRPTPEQFGDHRIDALTDFRQAAVLIASLRFSTQTMAKQRGSHSKNE